MNINKTAYGLVAAMSVAIGTAAWATEGGGSNFLPGSEQFAIAYTPPPGMYYTIQAARYHAEELRNNDGDAMHMAFRKEIQVLAPRITWVTREKVLGGRLVLQGLVPLLKVKGQVNSRTQTNTGLGDISLAAGLSYSTSPERHYAAGFTVTAPTGEYDKADLANPGRNYWSIRPRFIFTHTEPDGLNADLSVSYGFNTRNKATGYQSGQELDIDYSLGWGFASGWVAGVSGFAYQQTTEDKRDSFSLENSRGRGFGIGPAIRYDSGYGLQLTLAYQKEFAVKNRTAGDIITLKSVLPF